MTLASSTLLKALTSVIASGRGILWRPIVAAAHVVGRAIARPSTYFAERRAEAAAEREANRRHQLAIVESIIEGLNAQSRSQSDSIMALAKAQEKQSEAFADWLKLFTQAGPSAPQVDPEEQELLRIKAEYDALRAAGAPVAMPPEFALAYALKFNNEGFE